MGFFAQFEVLFEVQQIAPQILPKNPCDRMGLSCPSNEFIYIYLIFLLFMCFLHCLKQKRILHRCGNADTPLFEYMNSPDLTHGVVHANVGKKS
jgi:hypothetical protein